MTDADLPFTAEEADAIAELFNIGMGPPAAALSAMVGEEVGLSIPALRITTRQSIAQELGPRRWHRVCAVREGFDGRFSGEAMLVFPPGEGAALAQRLLGQAAAAPGEPPADLGEMEQDALTEIGNIILNGCLASFADLVDTEVAGEVPIWRVGAVADLLGSTMDPVLYVRIDVAVASAGVRGRTLFLLDLVSLDAFRDAVRRMTSAATA